MSPQTCDSKWWEGDRAEGGDNENAIINFYRWTNVQCSSSRDCKKYVVVRSAFSAAMSPAHFAAQRTLFISLAATLRPNIINNCKRRISTDHKVNTSTHTHKNEKQNENRLNDIHSTNIYCVKCRRTADDKLSQSKGTGHALAHDTRRQSKEDGSDCLFFGVFVFISCTLVSINIF